ncbi:hypothetical protein F443_22444 [Phytophthora nicotianae P1569]|uniref:DDE Tnp4 domain-containing protein n=2 Tax=Phytophthora nicotianae P1569 TaxID=1317065 RepID=V9DUA4_PHYNI|nr:hypothetical protein F443_22446 [Phytophthora nicotianae P1569]ETI30434.1 hypothetical protein F443_22444 [Phytophthora nicotianae P1569]
MEYPEAGYGTQLAGGRSLRNEMHLAVQETCQGLPARLVLRPQVQETQNAQLRGCEQREGADSHNIGGMEDHYDYSYGLDDDFPMDNDNLDGNHGLGSQQDDAGALPGGENNFVALLLGENDNRDDIPSESDSGSDNSAGSGGEVLTSAFKDHIRESASKMLRQTPKNSIDLWVLHRRRRRYRRLGMLFRAVACALAIQMRQIEKEMLRSSIPDVRFDINQMSERNCIDRFRFGKTHLAILLWKLQLPAFFSTEEGYRTSGIEGLCIVLERLSYPSRWRELKDRYGRHESNLSSIFYYVCEHIARRCAPLLDGDWNRISSRLEDYTAAVRAKGGELRNVWGFIDGTLRRICRPLDSAEQQSMFNGHKRCHGIKYQSVTTPDGMIAHLFGPIEGRLHDLTLLEASGLESTIQNDQRFHGYLLYGDPAYGQTDVFASPFDRVGATREESVVNASMSRVRITVEWGFGQVINEWALLDFKRKMNIGGVPVGMLYEVAVCLTNCLTISRGQNVISSYFDVAPPSFDEYFASIC